MNLKSLVLTAVFSALFIPMAQAQTYEHSIANHSDNAVEFVLARSPITIQGYSGNKIIVKNTDYQAPPKRAKGLHSVFGDGEDNSGIGLSVHQQKGGLKMVQTRAGFGNFTVKVPNNIRVKIKEANYGTGDIQVRNHQGEIEINAISGDVRLENITGPVVAHITSGNVNIEFSRLSDATPSSITAVSGDIDVTLPEAVKANLELSSVTGEIYTNFDIKTTRNKSNMRQIGGQSLKGTINGGGTELNLKTISGNIYLRKKE